MTPLAQGRNDDILNVIIANLAPAKLIVVAHNDRGVLHIRACRPSDLFMLRTQAPYAQACRSSSHRPECSLFTTILATDAVPSNGLIADYQGCFVRTGQRLWLERLSSLSA